LRRRNNCSASASTNEPTCIPSPPSPTSRYWPAAVHGKTPEQILARQTIEDLPPLTAERRDVPRELEDVLKRALRSDPAERFHSAGAFHSAVRGALGGFLRRLAALFRPEL